MKKGCIAVVTALIIVVAAILLNINNSYLKYKMPTTIVDKAEYNVDASQNDEQAKFLWLKENDNYNWNSFIVPGTPDNQKTNGYIWIRIKLPYDNYRDPGLYFFTYNQQFEVYINGKKIYKFGDMEKSKSLIMPGSFWHIIELPEKYKGKYVYIRMHSVVKADTGLVRNIEISSKINLIMNIIRKDIITFILAVMFIFVGISIIAVGFFSMKNVKVLLYFGVSCICAGVWLVSEGNIKQLFFSAPAVWEYVKISSQYLIPVCFSFLVNYLVDNRFDKISRLIGIFHVSLLSVALLLNCFNVLVIDGTLPVFYCSFALGMIIVMIAIIKDYPNWNLEIKVILFGLAMLCLVGIFDILNWNINPKHSDAYSTQWGLFIFLISISIAMILHFTKTQDKIDEFSEEIRFKDKKIIENMQQLEYFSDISHELRTPLNIILSTIQLIKLLISEGTLEIEEKDIGKYCNSMKLNCLRLLKLVNNLIDINKIDSGYLKPDFSNNDIVFVVENITQSVADYTKSRGIEVIFDTNIEEKVIAFDSEKIERIMLNLLSNAVKFSKAGSTIYVDIFDEIENVTIQVRDTGIGIKKEKIDLIFGRFIQVDKSLTRDHEGSGIGLSLVKSLVDMHGGTIICESEYGVGSTFIIKLPVRLIDNSVEAYNVENLSDAHKEKINIEFSDIY